jgi:pimeloyl-ACP methyl ester carboxylesterase
MIYQTDYCPASLGESPRVHWLGDYCLHFQAYASQPHDPRPPVLMIGGAFQSFRSFSHEVAELLAQHPVILLDLPSQGGNLQLTPELSLEQLADLIADFAEDLQLPPMMPIGLSYGSALAALFAARHPQRCERLLLSGITAFGRPGARLLLNEGLALLDEGHTGAFAEGAVNTLLNPLRLQQTGVAPAFRKALLRQVQRLSPIERERYRQNSQRLLGFDGFAQHPTCPTLIIAGEHDHFTQPWEHAAFSAACADARCALIHNADHLAQFERRETCAALFKPFMRGEPLPQRSPGCDLLSDKQLLQLDKRLEHRHAPATRRARLYHARLGEWQVELAELGFFGGFLQCNLPPLLDTRGWQLQYQNLPSQPVLPLRQDARGIAFVFPHSDGQACQALLRHFTQELLPAVACA